MQETIEIKRSPFLLIRNLIIVQLIAALAYFILAVVGNYQEIYNNFNLPQVISYEIARFFFMIFAEAALAVLVFLRWFFATYVVHENMFVIESGVLWKKRKTFRFSPPPSASYHANAFAKMLGFGTLFIHDRARRKPITLGYVPSPETYARLIEETFGRREGNAADLPENVAELLELKEHESLEFKASLRWDRREKKINRGLEKTAIKTIAGFLNSNGGCLILGVADDGEPVGLETDYATLPRQDADGFENHFTQVFNSAIGPEFRRFVKLAFERVGDKEVCVARVLPAIQPAYAKFDGDEAFFVRTGNSTTALQLSEAAGYIESRWKRHTA